MNEEKKQSKERLDLSNFSVEALEGIAQDPEKLNYYSSLSNESELSLRYRIFQQIGEKKTMPFLCKK